MVILVYSLLHLGFEDIFGLQIEDLGIRIYIIE